MRIGLDFDNTIVSYDTLFHKVAVEGGHVPAATGQTKLAVRDTLRADGKEQTWIEMQGYVYGARMLEAEPFPGVIDFLLKAQDMPIEAAIVSHKTRHPFAGPAYDLHGAARGWIEKHLTRSGSPLLPRDRIFFELTKDEKLARIKDNGFDLFVDDLPEILTHKDFPKTTLPVLFDPSSREPLPAGAVRVKSWQEMDALVVDLLCKAK